MQVSTKALPDLLEQVFQAGLVPMVSSSPGMGKSSIAKQVADNLNLKVIDVRLSTCDPTDLNGFPTVNAERTKAGYIPMDVFPIESDEVPNGYCGWLILLDELTSAPLAVQAAAYRLVLDREVGIHKLHPNVCIMGAGNLATDKAHVNRMSTAMQSRLVHFEMKTDVNQWINWAATNNIDYRIISYIQYRPEMLHDFAPTQNDKTFPCGRTWEMVSKLIAPLKTISTKHLPLIVGAISEGPAREFLGFTKIFDSSLPKIHDILNNPDAVVIPNEPSISYALSGLLTNHMDVTTAPAIMKVVNKMGMEFQMITLTQSIKRNRELNRLPEIQKWVVDNAPDLA